MKTIFLSLTFLSVLLISSGPAKADDSVDVTSGNTATMTGNGPIVTRSMTPKEKAQLKEALKPQAGDGTSTVTKPVAN